jgi:hypothetical protein
MAERIDCGGGSGQGTGGRCLPAKVPSDRLTMKVGSRHHHYAGGVRCLQGEYRERGEKHHYLKYPRWGMAHATSGV